MKEAVKPNCTICSDVDEGVQPGILCWTHGEGRTIQRCDACALYDSDESAAKALATIERKSRPTLPY